MTLARWLVLLACIILFCAGCLHVIGYSFVIPVLVKAGIDEKYLGALKAVWLIFSVELVVLSPAFVWISRRSGSRSLLLFLSLIPLADAAIMYYFVGPFIGAHMVGAGALLLVIGAWLLSRREDSTPAK